LIFVNSLFVAVSLFYCIFQVLDGLCVVLLAEYCMACHEAVTACLTGLDDCLWIDSTVHLQAYGFAYIGDHLCYAFYLLTPTSLPNDFTSCIER